MPTVAEQPSPTPEPGPKADHDELSKLQKENEELRHEIADLGRRNSSLATDSGLLNEARALAARLEEEKAQLESRVEHLVNLEVEVDRIRSGQERDQARVRELEADLAQHRDQAKTLQTELEQEQSRARSADEAAEQKAKEFESRAERQRDREGSLEAELSKLKQVSASTLDAAGRQLIILSRLESHMPRQRLLRRRLRRREMPFATSTTSSPPLSSKRTAKARTCPQSTRRCRRS